MMSTCIAGVLSACLRVFCCPAAGSFLSLPSRLTAALPYAKLCHKNVLQREMGFGGQISAVNSAE